MVPSTLVYNALLKKPGKVHSGSQKKWFLKRAAFHFLELLQVAFLELFQDITKVYSVGWKKRLTKPSFCFVGVTHGDAETLWVQVSEKKTQHGKYLQVTEVLLVTEGRSVL